MSSKGRIDVILGEVSEELPPRLRLMDATDEVVKVGGTVVQFITPTRTILFGMGLDITISQ